MDITTLVAEITALLMPALPYLLAGGEEVVKEVGKKIGGEVWHTAKETWEKIGHHPEVETATKDLVKFPSDGDAPAALRMQLKKILSTDEALAQELAGLLARANQNAEYRAALQGSGAIAQGSGAVAAGQGGIAIGGSVHGDVNLGKPSHDEP